MDQTDHDLLVTAVADIKHLNENVNKLGDALAKKNDDHESRIRASEEKISNLEAKQEAQEASTRLWKYIISTAVSVVGALAGYATLFK